MFFGEVSTKITAKPNKEFYNYGYYGTTSHIYPNVGYYRNGKYKAISVPSAEKRLGESDEADFYYVYHFRSVFKPGLNILRHSYILDLSNSAIEHYTLDYVLTAAKRWANRQIDDFTLQIDMGEFQDIYMENSFFTNVSEWKTDSAVKSLQLKATGAGGNTIDTAEFLVRKGMILFQKRSFKPAGDLHFFSFNNYYFREQDENPEDADKEPVFNWKKSYLPFSIDSQDGISPPADEFSKRILHNLPFARRGYIFKSADLQAYFERQKWYWPNPGYTPVAALLTKEEQEWLKK